MGALRATMRGARQEAFANRASFWTQVVAMAVNDLVWVVFWTLFFRRVGTLRGWDIHQVIVLEAVLTCAGGIVLGPLSNARRVGQLVVDGGLDAALALPVPTLPYLLVRRLDATNLGDLAFGLLLFAVAGHPTPGRVVVFALGVAAGVVVLTGFLVLSGSLAFFLGRGESGDLGFHAMLLFAAYPADVFTGAPRALLYTIVPAAFVSTVPARLLTDLDAGHAALLLAVAVGIGAAGWAVFSAGLRRYTSGSVWTRA